MPIFCRAETTQPKGSSGLTPEQLVLATDVCQVHRVVLPQGATLDQQVGPDDLVWFFVLAGRGTLGDAPINDTSVVVAGPDSKIALVAQDALQLIWANVPQAARFDTDIGPGIRIVDRSREPVLQSEHDGRTRVYVTTPGLSETTAIKAEIISYPAGAAAPEHYHDGAEHFQYVISGAGTAVLNGIEQPLVAGDVLYHYPKEWHYFFTDPAASETFVFVELFIPGHCETIWSKDANVCAWLPTGKDVRGRPPVRDIAYHVHGEDAGL
jgi:quercetin dioxygenase-like cupin family protein